MLFRPRTALLAAAGGAVLLALTGVLAYLVPVAHLHDATTLRSFTNLRGEGGAQVLGFVATVAHLANPGPYALMGGALALIALVRRRWRVAVAILALLVLTGATTESLKHLLAHPRFSEWLGAGQIAAASWPSGHATAAMTIALCGVLAAPPRRRPLAAALGAAFAIAVAYAILVLGWHFPSDVLGGYLVAATWTLIAVATLSACEQRWPSRARRAPAVVADRDALLPMVLGAGAAAAVTVAALARPDAAMRYLAERPGFAAVALGIAALATAMAVGLARVVRS